jgi:glycosyltransferase involved in cell wall biosynthesis
MEKIMVSAFACDPTLGSEPGVGWHWIIEMSKYYELWVLTVQEDHGSIKMKINTFMEKNGGLKNNIHFIYYDIPLLYKLKSKHIMLMRVYYFLWQKLTNKIVKQTMESNNINMFHLLTYGNMLWPISKFGQRKTFVWGPTGGMDTIERNYCTHYSLKSKIFEAFRRSLIFLYKNSSSFKNKCKRATLIICKTQSAYASVPIRCREKAVIFTDVASDTSIEKPVIKKNNGLMFVSSGHLDSWRGFDFLIEAFAKCHVINSKIELYIIGKGTEKRKLASLIKKNNATGYIHLTGEVSMEEYEKKVREADVIVNTCLKEGGVTSSFDCVKFGKPLICVDTGGYTNNFDNKSAIILPRKVSRETMIQNLILAINSMNNMEKRAKLSLEIQKKAYDLSWTKKGEDIHLLLEKKAGLKQ